MMNKETPREVLDLFDKFLGGDFQDNDRRRLETLIADKPHLKREWKNLRSFEQRMSREFSALGLPEEKNRPKTKDKSPILFWTALFATSAVALMAVLLMNNAKWKFGREPDEHGPEHLTAKPDKFVPSIEIQNQIEKLHSETYETRVKAQAFLLKSPKDALTELEARLEKTWRVIPMPMLPPVKASETWDWHFKDRKSVEENYSRMNHFSDLSILDSVDFSTSALKVLTFKYHAFGRHKFRVQEKNESGARGVIAEYYREGKGEMYDRTFGIVLPKATGNLGVTWKEIKEDVLPEDSNLLWNRLANFKLLLSAKLQGIEPGKNDLGLEAYLFPKKKEFKVGECFEMECFFFNNSDKDVWLVEMLVSSEDGSRFPKGGYSIKNPKGEKTETSPSMMIHNNLSADTIHRLEPGDIFHPYQRKSRDYSVTWELAWFLDRWVPNSSGEYAVSFEYETSNKPFDYDTTRKGPDADAMELVEKHVKNMKIKSNECVVAVKESNAVELLEIVKAHLNGNNYPAAELCHLVMMKKFPKAPETLEVGRLLKN